MCLLLFLSHFFSCLWLRTSISISSNVYTCACLKLFLCGLVICFSIVDFLIYVLKEISVVLPPNKGRAIFEKKNIPVPDFKYHPKLSGFFSLLDHFIQAAMQLLATGQALSMLSDWPSFFPLSIISPCTKLVDGAVPLQNAYHVPPCHLGYIQEIVHVAFFLPNIPSSLEQPADVFPQLFSSSSCFQWPLNSPEFFI